MPNTLRFRYARSFEELEPYAFILGWIIIWVLPYRTWPWGMAIVFLPDLAVTAIRKHWRSRAPIGVTAQRGDSGVALIDDTGRHIDGFKDGDVDTVTLVGGAHQTNDLRIDRKGQRALVFELSRDDDGATLAKRLGIDIRGARSRYRGAAIAAKPLGLPLLGCILCIAYSIFGSPDAETALWLLRINRFVCVPTVLLISIPTVIDIGRDGVAWRWLFIRRYVAFGSVVSMAPHPRGATGAKIFMMRMTLRDATVIDLPLGKNSGGASAHLLAAFEASQRAAETPPVDEWLKRIANESAHAWVQRLRAKSAAGGTYRGSDQSQLWALAEDPSTPHESRCAMLLVLGTTAAARERTRALASQVVNPDVQAVLQAIANGADDEQLARLLERVSST